MGLFSWAKETTQSLVSVVGGTVAQTYRTIANWYGPDEGFFSGTYAFIKRLLSGYSVILGLPRLFYHKDLKRARHIMAASATSFIVFYLGWLLFYEAGLKRIARYQNSDFDGSTLDNAAEWSFYFLMLRTSAEMTVNCIFYNLALYKAVNTQESVKPPYPKGKDGLIAKTLAGLASTAYYLGNLFILKTVPGALLEKSLGKDSIVAVLYNVIVEAHIYGASLAEYQMGDLSTAERSIIFANNKSAHIGIGVGLLTMRHLADYLVSLTAKGAKGYFVDEAIFNVVYQLFIVAVMTMNIPAEKPANEEESGYDFLTPGRALMAGLLKNIGDRINRSVQPRTYELIALPEPLQKKTLATNTNDKGIFVLCGRQLFYVCNKNWEAIPFTDAMLFELKNKFQPEPKARVLSGDELKQFLTVIQFTPNKLWKHVIRDYFNHPYWRLLLWLFVPSAVRSDAIFDKTSTRLFFEENLQTYLDVLDGIMQKRNSTFDSAAVALVTRLPQAISPVSDSERESYRFLFADGLQPQLDAMKEDLKWIGPRTQRELQKAKVQVHDLAALQALLADEARAAGEDKQEQLQPVKPVNVLQDIDENFMRNALQVRKPQGLFAPPAPVAKNTPSVANPLQVAPQRDLPAELKQYTVAGLVKRAGKA